MFGRRENPPKSKKAGSLLKKFFEFQVDTERMISAAREDARPAAILKPKIPIDADFSGGWFGGKAALPKGLVWPERDGKKLVFLGQINLATLPRDLWSGLGPRKGWLAIFLPETGAPLPKLLHFEGPLESLHVSAEGTLPNQADWTRCHNFKKPETFALPKWPIVVESYPNNNSFEIETPKRELEVESGTLLDAAYQPFDANTTSLLFDCLTDAITSMVKRILRFPHMKKLRPDDQAWFERQKQTALDTLVRFFEIEGSARGTPKFSMDKISRYVEELKELDVCDFEYLRDDADGYCELVFHQSKIFDVQHSRSANRLWWNMYVSGLENHALKAYTSQAATLPDALRIRLETLWKDEAPNGLGLMGHAPRGHIYTHHGPDSPNEVLLELNTSKLAGWIWADCYSLVLLIKRSHLRKGDFSSVFFDVTN